MNQRTQMRRAGFAALLLSSMGLAAACGDSGGDDDGMGGEGSGGEASGGKSGSTGGKSGSTGGKSGSTGGKSGSTGGKSGIGGGSPATGGMGGMGGMGPSYASLNQTFAKKVSVAEDLQAVSVTETGLVYVAGVRVENSDPQVVVARFHSDGSLDGSFGTDGVQLLNTISVADDDALAAIPGDESASGIAALSDGGAAISINANNGALGTKVVVARVAEDGSLVDTFGQSGFADVGLTDWTLGQDWEDAQLPDVVDVAPPSDSSYDIRLDTSGSEERLVVFGYAPARVATGRVDRDRYVVRLAADDGSLDTSFADAGVFSIDFGDLGLSDGGRRGAVLADGSTYSFGYTVLGDARHHIFIVKLDESGVPDDSFGFQADSSVCGAVQAGVICSNPALSVGGFAEAYGAAIQSSGDIVTTGYGRADDLALEPDLVSFRFSATEMDSNYGTSGGLIIDSGAEDRGRDAIALDDDRIVHAGKYDGVAGLMVTDPDGALWGGFGEDGVKTYSHDGNFRGIATNGSVVAAVADGGTDTKAFLAIFEVED